MTKPDVPHRFELELEVPGTPEQVWHAIATAEGISSWMMPTDLDARLGGALTFHMGPDAASHGRVTAFEPGRRFAYEEDWATLVGQAGADVTPLLTEFLVEARSGDTCVVRVVTSAFGTGADWENEFWEEMGSGWAPMLDNFRLYLTHFPDQRATPLFAGVSFPTPPDAAVAAVRRDLGVDTIGDAVTARGVNGRLERSVDRHFLLRVDEPVPGFLSFYAFATDDGSTVHLQSYLFSDAAPAYVEREQPAWQAWLEGVATQVAPASPA
jgi:uncharacterized protein YndB with AHSA1/START domain